MFLELSPACKCPAQIKKQCIIRRNQPRTENFEFSGINAVCCQVLLLIYAQNCSVEFFGCFFFTFASRRYSGYLGASSWVTREGFLELPFQRNRVRRLQPAERCKENAQAMNLSTRTQLLLKIMRLRKTHTQAAETRIVLHYLTCSVSIVFKKGCGLCVFTFSLMLVKKKREFQAVLCQ